MTATRVVVSVGTDHHPFERMLDWVASAQESLGLDVFAQRGTTSGRPHMDSSDYLSQAELDAELASADVVICHGGPGTIAAARRHGHRPIVIARDPSLGEHVDDHQMRFAAKLADEHIIHLASTLDELKQLILAPNPKATVAEQDDTSIAAVDEFASLMHRFLNGKVARRRLRDRIQLKRAP